MFSTSVDLKWLGLEENVAMGYLNRQAAGMFTGSEVLTLSLCQAWIFTFQHARCNNEQGMKWPLSWK